MAERVKFVILSMDRSGTTLLCDLLHAHPDVTCHYELFLKGRDVRAHARSRGAVLTRADAALRQTDPQAFVDRVYQAGPTRVVGFKMWHSQNRPVCHRLLTSPDVHKIVLERRNMLARYASHHLAKRNRMWRAKSADGSEVDRSPLQSFDPARFAAFVKAQYDMFGYYRTFARGPSLFLTYRQLPAPGAAESFAFLGVDPLPVEPSLKKLHGSDILARFDPTLHPEILNALRRLNRMAWLREESEP